MLQNALKIGLIVVALGCVAQDASAFGRGGCGWGGCGWGGCYAGCGYGGCGYGGCGYGGYAYGGGYGYYGGYAYGGYGAGAYLAGANGAYASPIAARAVASNQPAANSLLLTVNVPADAKVFVNDQLTKSTGERRQYKSTGLQGASVYDYRVRVEFVRNGKPVSEEKTVQLTAGQTGTLAFSAAPNAQVAEVATSAQR